MMSDLRRRLILDVAQGEEQVLRRIHILHNNFLQCDQILSWLSKNKITGKRLLEWINKEHNGSPLSAWNYVSSKINKDKDHKIILGRDFI